MTSAPCHFTQTPPLDSIAISPYRLISLSSSYPHTAGTPTQEAALFEFYKDEKFDIVARKYPQLSRQEVKGIGRGG